MTPINKAEGTLALVAIAVIGFLGWRAFAKGSEVVASATTYAKELYQGAVDATGEAIYDAKEGAMLALADGPPVLGVSTSQVKNFWQNYGRPLYVDQVPAIDAEGGGLSTLDLPDAAVDYANLDKANP